MNIPPFKNSIISYIIRFCYVLQLKNSLNPSLPVCFIYFIMRPQHIQKQTRQVTLPGLKRFYLSFLHEALLALGAGDGNLTFSPGDPDHLSAFGAIIIVMLPILQPIKELEELPVLLIALVGLAGKAAVQRPKHQTVGNSGQQQIRLHGIHKSADQASGKTRAKDRHIQFVSSVPTDHECTQSVAQPLNKLSNHKDITLHLVFFLHYIAIWQNFNNYLPMFTDCLTFL